MKKFLTFVSLLIVFVMSVSLVACTPSTDNGGGGGGGGGGTGSEWWTTAGELEKQDGKVVFSDVNIALTSIVTGADLSALETIIAKFNAEYRNQIYVNLKTVNQAEYDTTVSSQIANKNNPPALLMCHQKFLKSFTDQKLLQPFDEVIEKSGISLSMEDYSQGLAKYAGMGYDDYVFGVPADAQSSVVLVNKKLLAEHGGVIPTTHADMLELCKKVAMATGKAPIAWATEDDFFSNYVFNTALLQNDVKLYDEKTYRADWYSNTTNRQNVLNAIKSLRDFTDSTPACAEFGTAESKANESFFKNEALFLVCMPWNVNDIIAEYSSRNSITVDVAKQQNIGATSLAGWFALDTTSPNANVVFGDSHFFAMSKTVTSITTKAAICEFINWFTTNVEVAITWGEAGHISARTSVSTSAEYLADATIANYTSKFYGDINNFRCIGVTPYNADLASQLSALFTNVKNKNGNDESNIKNAEDGLNNQVDFFG